MYHRPICVKCECELRPDENGVGLLDMFNPSDKPDPQPYQIWDADLYKCPKCGYEVVVGFGNNAVAHHFDPDEELERQVFRYEANSRVVKNY